MWVSWCLSPLASTPPLSSTLFFSFLIAVQYFTVRIQHDLLYWSSNDGHVGCFQSSVGTNKAAVTEHVTTFSIHQMPRESHDAKWNCFKCQRAYAFVILINSAKLPSREVVAIILPPTMFERACFCTILPMQCYQTFEFLPMWWVKNDSSLEFQFLISKSFNLHFSVMNESFQIRKCHMYFLCTIYSYFFFFYRVVSHSLIH